MRFRAVIVLVACVSALAATLGEQPTRNFVFHYPAIDAPSILTTAGYLERERLRVLDALDVRDMPRVHVTFYLDHAALEAAAEPIIGFVPGWAYGLVTSETQIHCMSPNLTAWGPYRRRLKDVVHEFVHTVTLHMNPRFANNPRWLWEAVSVYEAGQTADLTALPYMVEHRPPTLDELNRLSDTRIYEVGYTIGEFIVKRWSAAKLRALIRASGDTQSALGATPAEFEREWHAFLRETYGL
jgi:hypothetical protein